MNVLERAIKVYGPDAQVDKAIEEMSELTKALIKLRHAKKDYEVEITSRAVAEEMADVEIMMEQLRMIYPDGRIQKYREEKLERLERRLDKGGE